MRDSHAKLEAEGIKLYALSYDDRETLREFSEAQEIPYTLLSDVDSKAIRQYGILNTEVSPDDTVIGIHKGSGQREGKYDGRTALRRRVWRKCNSNPLSFPKFLWKNFSMERAARRRQKTPD